MIDDKQIDLLLKHFSEIDSSVEIASWINPSVAVELITRLRQAEKDAARYRWLRDEADGHQLRGCMELNGEDWDVAVDRVMQCK